MNKKKIQKIIRIPLLLGTAISLFFVPWSIVWAWIQPLPDTVDQQVKETLASGFDGTIVYIDQANKPSELYAAGWHNREKKIPARPDALFKIASVTKLYVAVAMTKLIASERLALDNTVADFFPELVGRIENAETITLKLLIQHRSGIPNFTDEPQFWEHPPKDAQGALDYILDKPAMFAPDAEYYYCNTNYLLLSEIMNKVLGYNYQQYIKEEILQPLGLTHTYGSFREVENLDDIMSGYYVGVEGDMKTEDYGSMVATAEDVGIFLRALNDGSVFKPGEQEIYSTLYFYNHTGLIPGYQTIAHYHPEMDAVIVQFVNTTNFEGYNWNLFEIAYNRVVKIVEKRGE